jgi:hypothetical protein
VAINCYFWQSKYGFWLLVAGYWFEGLKNLKIPVTRNEQPAT